MTAALILLMRYYARACSAHWWSGADTGVQSALFTWFTRARHWYFSRPALQFEAVTLGLAVLAGMLVMPALIYFAGRYTLDAYANGGVFALYADYYQGLVEPRSSCWIVLMGPLVFLSLFRVFRWVLRKL